MTTASSLLVVLCVYYLHRYVVTADCSDYTGVPVTVLITGELSCVVKASFIRNCQDTGAVSQERRPTTRTQSHVATEKSLPTDRSVTSGILLYTGGILMVLGTRRNILNFIRRRSIQQQKRMHEKERDTKE